MRQARCGDQTRSNLRFHAPFWRAEFVDGALWQCQDVLARARPPHLWRLPTCVELLREGKLPLQPDPAAEEDAERNYQNYADDADAGRGDDDRSAVKLATAAVKGEYASTTSIGRTAAAVFAPLVLAPALLPSGHWEYHNGDVIRRVVDNTIATLREWLQRLIRG